jgi:hypothetical protein
LLLFGYEPLILSTAEAVAPLVKNVVLVLACVLALALAGRTARADSPFDGKWTQGPLKEEFTVQKWLPACGAPPVSGSTGGGEVVTIHEEGDELAIVGAGRVYRTNQCYDQMPTLSRASHSRDPDGHQWRTRCTTPSTDPRHAALNTLIVATGDSHIDLVETGRYESTFGEGRCIADIKRSRSFDAAAKDVPVATATATAPTPTSRPAALPPPPPDARCAIPGDPVRLEVRPSRKLLRPGESFEFRAVVVDASGCQTRTPTSWSADAAASKGASVDPGGKVTVPVDATEGTFSIVVTAAGKSAKVTVEIASASRYDELLAQSGLNAAGESDGASVALIATSSIGGGDAKAEDGSRRRRMAFIAIVVSLAVGLLIVGIIGSRRSRRQSSLARKAEERHAERIREAEERRKERAEQHAAAVRAHEESVARAAEASSGGAAAKLVCPSCRREYPPGSAFCPNDANRLIPLPQGQAGHDDAPLGGGPLGGICPTCKRGFDPGVKTCPHDGDELVPYPLYASRMPSQPPMTARGKICPTCGDRFEGNAAFCGKDGTALVLLN